MVGRELMGNNVDSTVITKTVFSRYITDKNGWFTQRLPSHEVKQFTVLYQGNNINAPILDIGSGSCSDTLYLKKQALEVYSIDIDGSPDILADLRKPLPFLDCYASAVFCRGVLHILSDVDQIRAIREMHRILQPQGLFYASFMISIFVDKKCQLITVDDYFGMKLDDLFIGQWSKGKITNHCDHCHYFGKYVGYKI